MQIAPEVVEEFEQALAAELGHGSTTAIVHAGIHEEAPSCEVEEESIPRVPSAELAPETPRVPWAASVVARTRPAPWAASVVARTRPGPVGGVGRRNGVGLLR